MTRDKQPSDHPFANLFEEAANISKAHGYDILAKQVVELKEEVKKWKEDHDDLNNLHHALVESSVVIQKENERLKKQNKELAEALKEVLSFEKRGADKGEPRIGNGILSIIHKALSKYTK